MCRRFCRWSWITLGFAPAHAEAKFVARVGEKELAQCRVQLMVPSCHQVRTRATTGTTCDEPFFVPLQTADGALDARRAAS